MKSLRTSLPRSGAALLVFLALGCTFTSRTSGGAKGADNAPGSGANSTASPGRTEPKTGTTGGALSEADSDHDDAATADKHPHDDDKGDE